MCWKWFLNLFGGNPPSTTWEHSDRVALLFVINNYPGSANDLNGCINDINLAEQKLKGLFQIRKFKDSEVTVANFKKQVEEYGGVAQIQEPLGIGGQFFLEQGLKGKAVGQALTDAEKIVKILWV